MFIYQYGDIMIKNVGRNTPLGIVGILGHKNNITERIIKKEKEVENGEIQWKRKNVLRK